MLKKLFLSLVTLVSVQAIAQDKLVLNSENTVVLNWVVTDQSVAQLTQQIFAISQSLPKSKPIYLVLDTPGGSVQAGNALIDGLKGIPQEVKTVNLFSASMGFQIAQNLGERLVTTNSTMMSHLAAGGIEGTIPGSLNARLEYWSSISEKLDVQAAKRLHLSKAEYAAKIQNEYWVYGEDNVTQKLADRLVTVSCDDTMNGVTTSKVETMFGMVDVDRAKCPMARGILSARVSKEEFLGSPYDAATFVKALFLLVNDKAEFTRQYIINGKFQNAGF